MAGRARINPVDSRAPAEREAGWTGVKPKRSKRGPVVSAQALAQLVEAKLSGTCDEAMRLHLTRSWGEEAFAWADKASDKRIKALKSPNAVREMAQVRLMSLSHTNNANAAVAACKILLEECDKAEPKADMRKAMIDQLASPTEPLKALLIEAVQLAANMLDRETIEFYRELANTGSRLLPEGKER